MSSPVHVHIPAPLLADECLTPAEIAVNQVHHRTQQQLPQVLQLQKIIYGQKKTSPKLFSEHLSNGMLELVPEPLGSDKGGEIFQEEWNYSAAVGMLLYVSSNTRPDIQFAVHQVARFSHHGPKKSHRAAVKRIVRYLIDTAQKGITFQPHMDILHHFMEYTTSDVLLEVEQNATKFDFSGLFTTESQEKHKPSPSEQKQQHPKKRTYDEFEPYGIRKTQQRRADLPRNEATQLCERRSRTSLRARGNRSSHCNPTCRFPGAPKPPDATAHGKSTPVRSTDSQPHRNVD